MRPKRQDTCTDKRLPNSKKYEMFSLFSLTTETWHPAGFPSATQFQLCLQQYILLSNTLLTQYYKEPWVRWLKHLPDRFKSLMLTCNYANSCDGELKKHVVKVVNLTCLLYVIRKSCHWAEILKRHLFGHLF